MLCRAVQLDDMFGGSGEGKKKQDDKKVRVRFFSAFFYCRLDAQTLTCSLMCAYHTHSHTHIHTHTNIRTHIYTHAEKGRSLWVR